MGITIDIQQFTSPFPELLSVFSNKKILFYTDLEFCTDCNSTYLFDWTTEGHRILWAGWYKKQFVGFVSAHVVPKHLTASLTIVVLPEYQRQGIGKQLLTFAKSQLFAMNFVRLEAQICTENIASITLFESSHFQQEGLLRKNFLIQEKLYDSYMYACLKEE